MTVIDVSDSVIPYWVLRRKLSGACPNHTPTDNLLTYSRLRLANILGGYLLDQIRRLPGIERSTHNGRKRDATESIEDEAQ